MNDPNQAGPNQPASVAPPAQSNYVPMPPAPHKGNGVLFAVLAFLVILGGVGVAAVLYLPKLLHKAPVATTTEQSAPTTQSVSTPTPTPTPDPNPTASQTTPAADANTATAMPDASAAAATAATDAAATTAKVAGKSHAGGRVGQGSAADYGMSAQEAAQRAADQQALDQLEHERSLLISRTASVDASLKSLKDAQAQQGLGLRGDISAAQERLHGNMNRLHSAIEGRDLKGAKQYMELCDRDADTLEKFLGR